MSHLVRAAIPTKHGFFTRNGGVSEGSFASLNVGLGSEDNPEHVTENRNRVQTLMQADSLLSLYQIHSNIVIVADENTQRVEGDAIITTTPGLAIGVLTADCVPVLFHDPVNRVIGAAHAGWKGALTGVTDNTITAMIEQGAERQHIIACVGPCIGKDSYEVGPEFKQNFLDDSKNNEQFFSPSPKEHHHMFNIAGYVLARLQAQNIDKVEHVNRDTYRDAKNFFSYRRSCHNDEPHYGRQISTICL